MAPNQVIEGLLRIPRAGRTLVNARRFDPNRDASTVSPGKEYFEMRSAMDLHPGVGKWISRRAIRVTDVNADRVADPSSSRLVAADEITGAVEGIRENGFYVFRNTAPATIIEAIRSHAETVPCVARGAGSPPGRYPRLSPTHGRYDISEEVALTCPEVQEFSTDPAMTEIARRYLAQPVIMDEVAFWWTTPQRSQDANLNAQLFHQDRDRLSFLKFFMYVTDVTTDTGPHVYVRGSHRRIPSSLRRDGRLTDEAVAAAGLGSSVTELCGPAGTIMAVDTIGLHKGKTPITSDRLALEIEFSTSLFGADFERPSFTPTPLTRERFHEMPWVLQRFAASM